MRDEDYERAWEMMRQGATLCPSPPWRDVPDGERSNLKSFADAWMAMNCCMKGDSLGRRGSARAALTVVK